MKTRHWIHVGARPDSPHPSPQVLGFQILDRVEDFDATSDAQDCGHLRPPSSCDASEAPEAGEFDPLGKEGWKAVGQTPMIDLALAGYSIQVPRTQRQLACPCCDTTFLASGPTGHEAGQPICDLCLLEGSHELGVLLALASTTRTFGAFEAESAEEYEQALADYGAFAKIYELIAARSGPPRLFPTGVVEADS